MWDGRIVHASGYAMADLEFFSLIAGHDDNHLDQLTRALDGRV